ncbi:hypothetical protein BH09ACT4_BH09ACT4_03410 [soil metagenome]
MKTANRQLFSLLAAYCERFDDSVEDPNAVRFVAGDADAETSLQTAQVLAKIEFGTHRSLMYLVQGEIHLVGMVGFESEFSFDGYEDFEPNPGLMIVVLTEGQVQPNVPASQVRNIVEVAKAGESGYTGHQAEGIESLFPPISYLRSLDPLDVETAWRVFLQLCAQECSQGGSWIDAELAADLNALSDLNIPAMPYEALCRSMFDLDPRSTYMALYRCIEATYAFESCRKLVVTLGLSLPWQELAAALESEMGWHPREADSLNLILVYADRNDLAEIARCLGRQPTKDPTVAAGRAIYELRNRIVHYRPGQPAIDVDGIDWNVLSRLLVGIVFSVFMTAFGAAR